ncbi:peroxisomal biogenesis factor 11 [Xylariaceae sp. FL0016]|nr:peroxisomal biogenesis factor 11 [Xylariaceae sp. FL0016]
MAQTLDQFIKFTTDSVGLERTFRLLQSIAQILSSFTLPFEILLYGISLTSYGPASPTAARSVLFALRQHLALTRRFFRLFRFIESFNSAQKLYTSLSPPQGPKAPAQPRWVQSEAWLNVFGRTFNGMYLMLEAATLIEAMQIEGFRIWSPEWERSITIEAQRFWLFSLVCGVFSGLMKVIEVLAYTPVPATGDGFAHGKNEAKPAPEGEKDEKVDWDLKQEQKRLRSIVQDRKEGRAAWRGQVRSKISKLGRDVFANALDITLPGSVVGWVKADAGTVGLAMFVTTILTSMDVWERCGNEVAVGK